MRDPAMCATECRPHSGSNAMKRSRLATAAGVHLGPADLRASLQTHDVAILTPTWMTFTL